MIRYLSIPVVLALSLLPSFTLADTSQAPCGSFQKMPDGKYKVVYPVKIESKKITTMIGPGTTIGPGTHIGGVDIYAALKQSCH